MEEIKKVDNDIFLLCYDLCVKSNFNRNNLIPMIKNTGLNEDSIKSNAIRYMSKNLNMKKEDINKHFEFFIPRSCSIMLKTFDKFIDYLIKEKIISKSNITDYYWVSSELEKVILKELHNVCESINWHDDLVSKKASMFFISPNVIVSKAREYRRIFLKENDRTIDNYIASRKKKRIYVKQNNNKDLLEQLIDTDSDNQIIKILTQIDNLPVDKKMKLLEGLFEEGDQKKIANVKEKIDIYTESKRKKENKEDNIMVKSFSKAEKIISDFIIYPNTNVEEFCKVKQIPLQEFGDCLSLVKVKNISLFNKYLEKIDATSKKRR